MSSKPSNKDMEAWQLHLDMRFPHVSMLRPDQVAKSLGCDVTTVANLFDQDGRPGKPWLMGIEFNAASGVRMARRIPRENAILFWASTANYRPEDFMTSLLSVINTLHPRELLVIQQRISELHKRAL